VYDRADGSRYGKKSDRGGTTKRNNEGRQEKAIDNTRKGVKEGMEQVKCQINTTLYTVSA
jgi:hypothetical protein